MDQSKKSKAGSLDAVVEGTTRKKLETGGQFCICSIYKDIPGKTDALCEPCRLALAARGERVADEIAGTSSQDQRKDS